jgi:hypothetical protein
MPPDMAFAGVMADPSDRYFKLGMDSLKATMNDQKSIFGIFVGLCALFVLWLWASGNGVTLWKAATGQSASAPGASNLAANTVGGQSAPLGGTSAGTTNTTMSIPNYAPTTGAITPSGAQSIGGNTYNGAMSGGVSITPTSIAYSATVPASVSNTNGSTNWLSWLTTPLTNAGIGGLAPDFANASFSSWSDPLAANVVGGNSAPLG